MNTSIQLRNAGQAIWFDNIQRSILMDGSLSGMITRGEIYGVTSNPSIFNQAITRTSDYDMALQSLALSGFNAEEIYAQLAMEDIRAAADAFLPLYHSSKKKDGYVSIEVNPLNALDAEKMLAEARKIWKDYSRPNLMIKIPATHAGIQVVRGLIRDGINVNVTLIFTLSQYAQVMEAYQLGLEERLRAGGDLTHVASVASFFVSRVDTRVDKMLQELAERDPSQALLATSLIGKAAIANTRLAYESFQLWLGSPALKGLLEHGAQVQRPLWASTGTKNPTYPDVLYVNELVAADTVNTVPPVTLKALLDHGQAAGSIVPNLNIAHQIVEDLEKAGINLEVVGADLEREGVAIFADAHRNLLEAIEKKSHEQVTRMGSLAGKVTRMVKQLADQNKLEKIWQHDPAAWEQAPGTADLTNRLGWMDLPERMAPVLKEIQTFKDELFQDGITQIFVLGMGGSSLAPEVFKLVFPSINGMELKIVDSTDPNQISQVTKGLHPANNLVIVSSKSGGTSEVKAFFEYFWGRFEEVLKGGTGNHFIAITDPGTGLYQLASEHHFRKVFLSDPNVGGRFSALTAFGLVPAGLLGLPLAKLLEQSLMMENECKSTHPVGRNPGFVLGCLLAAAAVNGKDKLSLLMDDEIRPFGAWLEQLIAESSGKNGKGILPIVEEFCLPVETYGNDRLFVYIRFNGLFDQQITQLQMAGHPVLMIDLKEKEDLFKEFYLWEFATAVACAALGENAFDQPDVQDNKTRTIAKIAQFKTDLCFVEPDLILENSEVQVYAPNWMGLTKDMDLKQVLRSLLKLAKPGDYLAINAYLPYTSEITLGLAEMRKATQAKTGIATTSGFGPRFLHSTGQYHKGGPDTGIFLQITADADQDIQYGDLTFGQLERAQALGDYESLADRKRRIVRIHLKTLSVSRMADVFNSI